MKIFLLPGLLGLSLTANAQTQKPADPCRYYITLQSAGNWYEIYYKPQLYGTPPNRIKVSPWLLSAGYFIWPRLAVQTGVAYSRRSADYSGGSMADAQGHLNFYDIMRDESTQAAIPLLLRYSLSRRKPRLRADALLGVV